MSTECQPCSKTHRQRIPLPSSLALPPEDVPSPQKEPLDRKAPPWGSRTLEGRLVCTQPSPWWKERLRPLLSSVPPPHPAVLLAQPAPPLHPQVSGAQVEPPRYSPAGRFQASLLVGELQAAAIVQRPAARDRRDPSP